MADGSPVTDFNACILYDEHGNEIKEWYALAAYLEQFGEDGVHAWYAQSDGRKNVSRSWNPIQLVKNPNWITLVVLAVLILVVLLTVLLVGKVVAVRRHSRYGRSYRRRYRG